MKTVDRIILSVIAVALCVVAVRPLVAPSATEAQTTKKARVPIEYLVKKPINTGLGSEGMEKVLNGDGKDGWELIVSDAHLTIFKR